ncbi:virulence factor SrfB [Chania multitudinisentens RB-25]|uniref:Virulence factor SrfB n=1 Tax=Chania multitudinisentens RB-25 TaxID=1441930 RepID=W0LF16_9GAMM|nr:virulence factor SrfB [Chania multitudinisentens]AHG22453.1 virulence factor SrfB [Chania multitudinisentens RB-25]
MLATAVNYQQCVTLIANSGIQFLDFAVTLKMDAQPPGKFVRQTANGPLLRLIYSEARGKYLLPQATEEPEVVRPEFSLPLEQSLRLLNQVWLPLPFFRFNPPSTFLPGPDNWARVQIITLEPPEQLRITLAFDTKTYPPGHASALLAPNHQDLTIGLSFALAHRSQDLADFLDATWVDGWLREVFTQQAMLHEQRQKQTIQTALREFEYQAHYLNLLELLANQLRIPIIKLGGNERQQPIPVDLILDVGNSHSCGVLVEDHPAEPNGLKHRDELQLRDLSKPHYLYGGLFSSRTEFAQAKFGKPNYSFASGRDDAFQWPTLTRVGHEAWRLAQQQGEQGSTGLSSPRHYLWDQERYAPGWRFNRMAENSGQELPATAAPLAQLLNDEGQPLYSLPPDERLPVFSPHYSRSALMAFMLSELLAQALMQINSVVQRYRRPHSTAPRRLRTLILTLPAAMSEPEREIFRQRIHEAIALVWQAMGWHPADTATSPLPLPNVRMEWDEAACSQLVYLYNEIQVNFSGHAEAFFTALARPDNRKPSGEKILRIASVDIGGGTTDLAITQYQLGKAAGNQFNVTPQILFRDGFNVAGDDILLEIIQRYVLPALQAALKQAGVTAPDLLMSKLCGQENPSVCQQKVTLQLFMPLGQAILERYERFHPLQLRSEIDAVFGELLIQMPAEHLLKYINGEVQRQLPADAEPFDILQVPLILRFNQLHAEFLTSHLTITRYLRLLAEVIALHNCDVLLLTGRPARFPGIQALFRQLQPLPSTRIIALDHYHIGSWYPFSHQGRIDNPKSTAAVGAMLCLLAQDLRLPGFYFKAAGFHPYSTLRYLGRLSSDNLLPADQVYYSELNLELPDGGLSTDTRFAINGTLCLGFRQLNNEYWPAAPLFTLTVTEPQLMRKLASGGLLFLKLALQPGQLARFLVVAAELEDGSPVPTAHVQLKLNTLAGSNTGAFDYWIDSGSVFKP